MIITKLQWWLGNQMFQYAIWKVIANKHKSKLFIDSSQLTSWKDEKRQCEIDFFNTKYLEYIDNLVDFSYDIKKLIKFQFKKIFWKIPFNIVQERTIKNIIFDKLNIDSWWYNFHPEVLNSPNNSYLIWFWQSYKYFQEIENELRIDFIPKKPIDWKNKDILNKLKWKNTCSIHVRRWDYTNQYHGFCSLEYYNTAISIIKKKYTNVVFLVFSNDIEWCKKYFLGDEFVFIDWNTHKNSYRDMILMSKCKHNIIANSSFSRRWGWLNNNLNKTVIAPKKRFNVKFIDTSDLFPNNWLCL